MSLKAQFKVSFLFFETFYVRITFHFFALIHFLINSVYSTLIFIGQEVARVNGVLGVARAMGDFELEGFITCEPDVFKIDGSELEENFLVAACDGLWDVVEDSVVIKTVTDWLLQNENDVEGASKKYVKKKRKERKIKILRIDINRY